MRQAVESRLTRLWYDPQRVPPVYLRFLSVLFGSLVAMRRALYRRGIFKVYEAAVPVIVVGNVTVGGSGKTPLVVALCAMLREMGLRPGIVSRGYGGTAGRGPLRVTADEVPQRVGDEPLMLARRTGVPVVVGLDRVACARAIQSEVDIIVSDDGLQHLRLGRQLEIVVIDDQRAIGNARLLPAGPLREPPQRLAEVNFVIRNGAPDGMQLEVGDLVNLRNPKHTLPLRELDREEVHAVAGIGHPRRFFDSLASGLARPPVEHPFPDHHAYTPAELAPWAEKCVVMTEKDAVKCEPFAGEDWWSLPVNAQLARPLAAALQERIDGLAGKGS